MIFKIEDAVIKKHGELLNDIGKWLTFAIFLAILSIGAFLRFYRLSDYGIYDNDVAVFSDALIAWNQGTYDYYYAKVGYIIFGALSIIIIGFHDYNLCYVSAFFDVINILLLFFIGGLLFKSNALRLSVVALYAFCWNNILECMIAQPLLTATAFSLFSFYLLLKYIRAQSDWRKSTLLLLLSFSLFFGCTVHPTLFYTVPAFAIYIIISHIEVQKNGLTDSRWFFGLSPNIQYRQILMAMFIFAMSFFGVFFCYAIVINQNFDFSAKGLLSTFQKLCEILTYLTGVQKITQQQSCSLFELFQLGFVTYLPDNIPKAYIVLFYFSIKLVAVIVSIMFIYRLALKSGRFGNILPKTERFLLFNSILIVWGFLVLYFLMFRLGGSIYCYRYSTPIIPFVLLGIVLVYHVIVDMVKNKYLKIVLGIPFFIYCLHISKTSLAIYDYSLNKQPQIFRIIGNQLQHRVNDENRVLVAPYYALRNALQETTYLDSNWVYRMMRKWKPETTLELIVQNKIKYVLIYKYHLQNYQINSKSIDPIPGTPLIPEDAKQEIDIIINDLIEKNAAKIYSDNYIDIFELPVIQRMGNLSPEFSQRNIPFFAVSELPMSKTRKVTPIKR